MDSYVNISYATSTPLVFVVFGVSCVVSGLLFIFYLRRSNAATHKKDGFAAYAKQRDYNGGSSVRATQGASPRGSRLENPSTANTPAPATPGDEGGNMHLLTASLLRTSTGNAPNSSNASPRMTQEGVRRPRREAASVTFQDWGSQVVVYGLDLGSYSIKGHVFKDGKMLELPSKRAVVSVVEGGIVIGDVEVALDNPDTSFFSLTRDLAAPDSVVNYNDVVVRPYQALAGAIVMMLGERTSDMPPVGLCIPPYLQHVAQFLYLSATSANLQRCLIYNHSAACMASLLRLRQINTKKQTHKPLKNVVFVDFGRSGVVAYVCEVRDSSGSVRFQTFRSAGIQNMESRMVLELSAGLDDEGQSLMANLIEAAKDIREDFANVPEYLAATKRVASAPLHDEAQTIVEISRERFDEVCSLAITDLEEVAQDITMWLSQNAPHLTAADIELHLVGQGFRSKVFRSVFENKFDRRNTHIDAISVSQGVAQLLVSEHPLFTGQRFDIYPLFQLPTVDELGVRRQEEVTAKRFNVLSPRAAQRSSSQLARDRSRSDSSSFGTGYGSTSDMR